MTETVIHIVGHVGTELDHRVVGNGTHLSQFRLASTPRYYDKGQRAYVDDATNWLSVQCWRALALNISTSLKRGDPVIVIGKLKTKEWEKDKVRHSRFVLEATAIGHDLTRGVATFTKKSPPPEIVPDYSQAALEAAQDLEAISAMEPVDGGRAFADLDLADAS